MIAKTKTYHIVGNYKSFSKRFSKGFVFSRRPITRFTISTNERWGLVNDCELYWLSHTLGSAKWKWRRIGSMSHEYKI